MKKALSVKQPYAFLICKGIKNIENRTWRTSFRGRVYIHVGANKVKDHWSLLTQYQYKEAMDFFLETDSKPQFELSAIIGHVDIVDCVINHSSIWAEKTPLYTNGMNPSMFKEMTGIKPIYNWILANPVLFDKPIIDVKGKLSLWDCSEYLCVPDHVTASDTLSEETIKVLQKAVRTAYKTK